MSDPSPLLGTDWEELLGQEFDKEYWSCLQRCIEQERSCYQVFPRDDQVFAALRLTQCSETKVVIVGQDPYYRTRQAHGLAFSVRHEVPIPPSLKNIHQELHDDQLAEIPNHGCLQPWARRGVLLLNTLLTVREGAPRSHRGMGWEVFTDEVLRVVDAKIDPVVFLLWGKEAQRKKEVLINAPGKRIIESAHPSPQSARRGFLGTSPFSAANGALVDAGGDPVNWDLTEAMS